MLIFSNILVSKEILLAKFSCDLNKCLGLCCSGGDIGAPLTYEEALYFNENLNELLNFPKPFSERIKKYGVVTTKYLQRLNKNTYCTTTCEEGNCVFVIKRNNIYYCYLQLINSKFLKPISCRLFPIRERTQNNLKILELFIYDECKICYNDNKPFLVEFLKNELVEIYGLEFYNWAINKSYELSKGELK